MISNATLSTISSLIRSMKTRKASKNDFIVHVDSKGFKAPDGGDALLLRSAGQAGRNTE